MLMYANMAIDAIQSGKTAWLNQYVQDESVRKPLQHFVEAQTEFTKQIAKIVWEVTGRFSGDKALPRTLEWHCGALWWGIPHWNSSHTSDIPNAVFP